ncbi:MAG: hypothetical protein PF486_08055 [Prolixibacteraceae bacterium]|jgi:uncharacterized protein YebE (UPF0316 family)|nr:hypothetical protein [Prolixibacteraceae bacterium]
MYLRDLNKRIKDFGWDLSRASGRKNTRWLVSCLSGSEYKKYCKIKTDLKNLSEKHFLITQKANNLPRNVWLYRKYNFEIVFLLLL